VWLTLPARNWLKHFCGTLTPSNSTPSVQVLRPARSTPRTLGSLQHLGVSTEGLHSKSIDEFAGERFDYVITLCDKSSLECHALPGAGEVLAWNFEDPMTSTKHDAFRYTLHEIHERIKMFVLVKTKR
jgi:protein-tyrosine-phosphatase